MREDMFKVIVERPRLINSNGHYRDGRSYRNSEEAPTFVGMKEGYKNRKWLNENLRPLERYLEQQVNRPWDKVYSEICATIDPRNTVKQHILQHLDDFVAIKTIWKDGPDGGCVLLLNRRDMYITLEESWQQLCVHPRTGILLRNRRYRSYKKKREEKRLEAKKRVLAIRQDISDLVQLHCFDGIWYRVQLKELPPGREVWKQRNGVPCKEVIYEPCWDIVRKTWVSIDSWRSQPKKGEPFDLYLYGCKTLYAVAKQQLNSRELQKYGLIDLRKNQKASTKKKARLGLLSFCR